MPVRTKLLEGPSFFQPAMHIAFGEELVTKPVPEVPKKKLLRVTRHLNGRGEVRNDDYTSWGWFEGDNAATYLMRSPVRGGAEWMTRTEFETEVTKLIARGAVFHNRRGYVEVTNPTEGTPGWLTVPGHRHYRTYVRFTNGSWRAAKYRSEDRYW